ncbi:MAG: leucine-rich repeat domain-containing protein, partial [Firmicutes bacterium]|nr:leucine-rich repeat domain-containing protein [Bacillota bacterium]
MECFVCNKRMNDGAPHITLPSSGGAVACPHCFEKEAGHYARILKRLAVRRVIGGFIQLALWVLGLGLIIFPGFREGDVWAVIVGLVLAGASGIAWGWNKGKNEVDWVDKKFTQHYVIAEDGYVHRDYGETAFNVFWRIFYVILGVILGVFITPYNVIMKFFDAGQYSRGAKHTRRLRDRLRASLPADSPYGKLHEAWNKQKDFVVFMCEKAKQDIAGTYLELMNAINDAQPILLELAGSPGGSEYWESIGLKLIEANDEIVKVFEAAGKDWQAASQRGIWELHRKLAELATWLNGLRAPVFATIDGDAGAGSGKKKGRRAIAIVTACIVGLSVVIFGINSYDTRTRLTYELVAGGYSVSEVFNGDKLRSVKIPATYDGLPVVAIGNNAFSGCGNLTSITIPSGVTDIGRGAFSGCSSLTSITIPPSVTVIKSHTFSGCSSLSSITISFGVTNIDDAAFNDCGSLASVTIPSSVTRIGGYAFRGCGSLVSITIPSSVTGIGDSAFSGCSSLTSVTIPS